MVGIYKIECKANNKVYIGESQDIENRWNEHKFALIIGNHHSYKLQSDYNKYGKENFEFEVLEELDKEFSPALRQIILLVYENKYILQYDSINYGYNVEDTLTVTLNGKKGIFENNKINNRHIGMLRAVMKNIENNDGVYISSKSAKKKLEKKIIIKEKIKLEKDKDNKKKLEEKNKKDKVDIVKPNNICGGIGQIKCKVNGKVFISKYLNANRLIEENIRKLRLKLHSNKELQSDFNLYGEDNFELTILDYNQNNNELELKSLLYIDEFNKNNLSYNHINERTIELSKLANMLQNRDIQFIYNYKINKPDEIQFDFALLNDNKTIMKFIVIYRDYEATDEYNYRIIKQSNKIKEEYAKLHNIEIEFVKFDVK